MIRALLLLSFLGCSAVVPAWSQEGGVEPVPRPAPGAVEEAVAAELEAAHERVEEAPTAGAYGELGRLYAAYELWEPARAALADAIALEESTAERRRWVYLLGYAHERSGAVARAAELYARAMELAPAAVAPRARLAEALLVLGRDTEARPLFEELAESGRGEAFGHYGLGRLAARRGDHRAAAEHFARALALQPRAAQVHYPLAQAYRRLGDVDAARRHLEALAAADAGVGGDAPVTFPDPLVAGLADAAGGSALHKHLGDQALLAGRTADAATAYRRAVEADPESYAARKSLGLTLAEMGAETGETADAERQLLAALELDPGLPAAQVSRERARVLFSLGGLAANRGAAEPALERFRRAVQLDPQYAEAHLELGNLLGRAGRLEEAAEAFGRALDLEPPPEVLARALLQRATTLMDLGRFGEAVPLLERRLELTPGDARVRELLEAARAQ